MTLLRPFVPFRRLVSAAVITAIALKPGATHAVDREDAPLLRVPPAVDRIADVTYSVGGPLDRQLRGVIDNWLIPAPMANPAILEMFAHRDQPPYRDLLPWSGEFAGKYLTGCTQILRLTENAQLRAQTAQFVARLVSLQDADGYLGPFPKMHRLTGTAPHRGSSPTWDAWGHYHMLLGLLLWHQQTNDKPALRCAARIGDLLCDRFLGGGKRVFDIGSPDQNQAVVHGLCLLYESTRTARYLELAEQIVSEFEIPGAGDYLRAALKGTEFHGTPKPRWESLHAILGLIELYRITGKEDYRHAFEQIWWSIVKLDRHNNGGFSSGERAVGNPYDPAPIETCCTIAWLAMSLEMLRTTGDSIVADEMEITTWNSVVGFHAPDGKWSTYNTPMDGRRVPNTHDISFQIRPGSEQLNCCSVNAARGFGILNEWACMSAPVLASEPPTLLLNWYGPMTVRTAVGGKKVRFEQVTDYPRSGRVVLTVIPAAPARFILKVRVPHWSTRSRIVVNDRDMPATSGTYCALEREWKAGDQVVIELDMGLRAWIGERECAGKVSLYRGPCLLAHEPSADATSIEPIDLASLHIDSLEDPSDAALIALDVTDDSSHRLRLRDFGSAGQNGVSYISWLPLKGGKPTAFSRANPFRTQRLRE